MYYQYFGLNEAPFSIAVNPRYLFMSPRHRDALAHLLYGVGAGGGFILLTGEVGTGKTTINRCLLEQLPPDTDVAIILNPALNAKELLASVCDELGVRYDRQRHTLKSLTDDLQHFLLENHMRGRRTVLLIDEAQHLDFEVLEQIRLLTNLETNSEKLLQIILIGQPELAEMLARPELRQLNQRITARYNLEPLNLEETGAYIRHRLQVAGMSPERVIFGSALVRGIHKATRGIPRLINVLCDRLLLGAYGRNKSRVDQSMLKQAASEVLGEPYTLTPNWKWFAIAGVAGLCVWIAGWLLGNHAVVPAAPAAAGSVTTALESTAAIAPVSGPVTQTATVFSPAEDSRDIQVVKAPEAAPLAVSPSVATASMASVMLPTGSSLSYIWKLYSEAPVPDSPCQREVGGGVSCFEGMAWTWDELADIDRPLSLDAVSPERFSAEVLLLGMEGSRAWVLSKQGVAQVSLAELAPYWTGRYRFLWRVPQGFEESLSLGEEDAAVASVARWFAQLDGQSEPLADQVFNHILRERVLLFQREHALIDDGMIGLQTLLNLNKQLGFHITAEQARQWLMDTDVEVQKE
ncbi:MAG: AAA family ATPase [Halioglobus sp.]|nr:AAA family ATPase [Halioglobus sp.]